jgi:hypothetical protein
MPVVGSALASDPAVVVRARVVSLLTSVKASAPELAAELRVKLIADPSATVRWQVCHGVGEET